VPGSLITRDWTGLREIALVLWPSAPIRRRRPRLKQLSWLKSWMLSPGQRVA
jgi:hypothetical protein